MLRGGVKGSSEHNTGQVARMEVVIIWFRQMAFREQRSCMVYDQK